MNSVESSLPRTELDRSLAQTNQGIPVYDLSQAPRGKPVDEARFSARLEELRNFRAYSETAGAFMVFGGQVAVNSGAK